MNSVYLYLVSTPNYQNMKTVEIRFLLFCLLFLNINIVKSDSLKVLFLGNSHTFSNNVPQLVASLALSLGDTLIYEYNTPGGCTLGHPENGHLYNPVSLALIDSMAWDYVILQEHSLFAVIEYYRNKYMYPGAKSLDSLIKLNNECTETIVQVIWGKKYGGQYCMYEHCSVDFVDFAHMQDSLTSKYRSLCDTISCTLSPAGPAWKESITNGDLIELFSSDESHSSPAGAYLAACVHYCVLFQKTISGADFIADLSEEDALYFQNIADDIVFSNPELWNVNANKPLAGFELTQDESTVFCKDTSLNASYFVWDFGDGTTDTVQNPEHTYETSGTFVITQEVGNNCYSDVIANTVEILISDYEVMPDKNWEVIISAGKTRGVYYLLSTNSILEKIEVIGLDGKLKQVENNIMQNEFLLDLTRISDGFYILNIETDKGIHTLKITK